MIKLHCDLCDKVIPESDSRVVFKHFPNQRAEISIPQVKLEQPDVNVTICEDCLSHYTLADIVARFERKKFRRCSMTVYKMLTPKLRGEITEGIDQLLEDVKTCEKNALTEMQFESLSALKTLIGQLPDGYPMPFKEGHS